MDADALHALMLQIEWGADEALAVLPVVRLAPVAAAPPVRPAEKAPAVALRPSSVPVAGPAIVPADIGSLEALRAAIERFQGCALSDTATGAVLPEGDPASGLLVIYGPPSDDDDRARKPLSGPAGKYFDAMLASIGLERASVLVSPLIPWRPPGGRPPSPPELGQCLPFLHRLIALAEPRLVLLMGTQAARAVLGPERRARHQMVRAEVPGCAEPVPCIALAAPDELVRSPDQRPASWGALRATARLIRPGPPTFA